MFDVFFGGSIYLRGEGLVLGQPAVVAAEYNVTVRNVLVKEGERVAAGQVLVQISSQQLAEARARLSAEAAARAARLADLEIRKEVVNATLAAAEDREAVAAETKNQLNESYKKGLLSALSAPPLRIRPIRVRRMPKHCARKSARSLSSSSC